MAVAVGAVLVEAVVRAGSIVRAEAAADSVEVAAVKLHSVLVEGIDGSSLKQRVIFFVLCLRSSWLAETSILSDAITIALNPP